MCVLSPRYFSWIEKNYQVWNTNQAKENSTVKQMHTRLRTLVLVRESTLMHTLVITNCAPCVGNCWLIPVFFYLWVPLRGIVAERVSEVYYGIAVCTYIIRTAVNNEKRQLIVGTAHAAIRRLWRIVGMGPPSSSTALRTFELARESATANIPWFNFDGCAHICQVQLTALALLKYDSLRLNHYFKWE